MKLEEEDKRLTSGKGLLPLPIACFTPAVFEKEKLRNKLIHKKLKKQKELLPLPIAGFTPPTLAKATLRHMLIHKKLMKKIIQKKEQEQIKKRINKMFPLINLFKLCSHCEHSIFSEKE